MQNLANTIQNNALASLTKGASSGVLGAIQKASTSTGVNFAYLVQQAKAESNFNPDIKAKTSSATGLFQFINSTWLSMVEKYGDKHGIDTQGKTKQQILELRKDPEVAANMAAEFAKENEQFLNNRWGGEVGSTELYFAHFLGAPKAASFLNARDQNGSQPAAVIFPKEAKANYNVFFEKDTGRAKSLDEVYAFFDKKFGVKDLDPNLVSPAVNNKSSVRSGGLYAQAQDSVIFTKSRNSTYSPLPYYQLVQSPVELMLLSQLDAPGFERSEDKKNSLF